MPYIDENAVNVTKAWEKICSLCRIFHSDDQKEVRKILKQVYIEGFDKAAELAAGEDI